MRGVSRRPYGRGVPQAAESSPPALRYHESPPRSGREAMPTVRARVQPGEHGVTQGPERIRGHTRQGPQDSAPKTTRAQTMSGSKGPTHALWMSEHARQPAELVSKLRTIAAPASPPIPSLQLAEVPAGGPRVVPTTAAVIASGGEEVDSMWGFCLQRPRSCLKWGTLPAASRIPAHRSGDEGVETPLTPV